MFLAGSITAFGLLAALLFLALSREVPAPGGSYSEAISGSPQALNPLLAAFNDPDRDITSLLFTGLTRMEKDGSVRPDLAESWQVSEDGKSYIFRLRSDAEWHDGKPVTADDAVMTAQALGAKDLPTDPELIAMWAQVKADKQDDATVRLTLNQPFAPFLSYTVMGLIPAHAFQGVVPKDMAAASKNPVGTGAFRLREATIDHVTLAANPKAYNGRPMLDQLDFHFFRDEAGVAAAVVSGTVDGGLLYPSAGKDAMERVRNTSTLAARLLPRYNYTVMFLNAGNPLFQNKQVRQALSVGANREELVAAAVGGAGKPASGPIPADSWAADASVPATTYQPDRAAQLLDEAGWKLGESGAREKDGTALRFSLLTNDDPARVAVANGLSADYQKLGVQVDVQASGITGLMQNFLIPRKYDAILFGMDPGYDPDPYPYWHSSQIVPEGLNVAGYSNPEVDKLLERARTTTSVEERKQLYAQFQERFVEDVPSVVLYHPLYAYVQNKRLRGIDVSPLHDTSSRFYNIKDWYTATQRVFGL